MVFYSGFFKELYRMNLIELRNIHKSFEAHKALNGVSFSIPKGSIFGLLGPNGAGKTTSIRIINQIIAPDEGEVLFEGRPIRREDIQKVGYLPEERGLYKKMNIADQVIYLGQLKGLSKAEATLRCKQWFERFDLQKWWNKHVADLSKGMQQKVQFIATILHEPDLVILDEPFSGFDPVNAEILKEEILNLKQRGATILFSSHRMESVETLCDSLVMIHQSKVVLSGTTREIRQAHKSSEIELLFEGNIPDWMQGFPIVQTEDGQKVVLPMAEHSVNEWLQKALQSQLTIHSCRELIPGLNEIFIQIVQNSAL
jgi:ABC-2 type transport system ATP-binding protein